MILKDDANIKESTLNSIKGLCDDLDFLTSPDVEEKMVCTFDCCIGNNTLPSIEIMIEYEEKHHLFGQEGLELLRQLNKRLDDAIYYDDEKDFSKKQRWLDFVDFASKVNIFLKDVLKKHAP